MPLPVDVETGDPDHAGLHNDVNEAVNTHVDDLTIHSSGRELGYTQVTNYSAVAMNTTPADAASLTTTVTVGTRPIVIQAVMPASSVAAAASARILIMEGATALQVADTVETAGAKSTGTVRAVVRLAPTAGSHTYKVQMATTSSTGTYSSNALYPALIHVVEC